MLWFEYLVPIMSNTLLSITSGYTFPHVSALAQSDIMMWRALRCYSSPILPLFNMQQRKQIKILPINSLKLLHKTIQESLQQLLIFTNGLQLSYGLTSNDILLALQAAYIAADEYYTIRHVMSWNTDFVIPAEAIAAKSDLFTTILLGCVVANKVLLATNRLLKERIISIFGPTRQRMPGIISQDFNILLEFAEYGITPICTNTDHAVLKSLQ